jgi:hypothetical protein
MTSSGRETSAVILAVTLVTLSFMTVPSMQGADPRSGAARAVISGDEPGWRPMGLNDFTNVNCHASTWSWDGEVIRCTGEPVGVIRSLTIHTNIELLVEWRHLRAGGNSGVFLWAPEEAFTGLSPGKLPKGGIEVQILDHGYAEQYERRESRKADWFTTNGDVFPVGTSTMVPFPPLSPNGKRSFPRKTLSRGHGEWNQYYIRAVNGEVRLWVNGEEVSGGTQCQPSKGYLCLESEGAPIEFRNLRVRVLP